MMMGAARSNGVSSVPITPRVPGYGYTGSLSLRVVTRVLVMSLDESPSFRMMPMRPAGVLGMVTMSVPAAATLTGRRSWGSSRGVAPNGGNSHGGRSVCGERCESPVYRLSAGGEMDGARLSAKRRVIVVDTAGGRLRDW